MEGILIAAFLGWLGGYRFYKKQYGLFLLYFFTCGIFGFGWLIDIFSAIANSSKKKEEVESATRTQPQLQEAPVKTPLRTYKIKQSDLLQGFEKIQVNTTYELVQDGIRTLRTPNPNNPTHPYTINIGNEIVFKEMEYRTQDGLECFQIYVKDHHIGTIFDSSDNFNRFYIQAMIQGKVDACHVEINPKPIYAHDQNDYEYETKLWMHLKG